MPVTTVQKEPVSLARFTTDCRKALIAGGLQLWIVDLDGEALAGIEPDSANREEWIEWASKYQIAVAAIESSLGESMRQVVTSPEWSALNDRTPFLVRYNTAKSAVARVYHEWEATLVPVPPNYPLPLGLLFNSPQMPSSFGRSPMHGPIERPQGLPGYQKSTLSFTSSDSPSHASMLCAISALALDDKTEQEQSNKTSA